MNSKELTPVLFNEANSTLSGRELKEQEKQYSVNSVKDIPCYKKSGIVITQWKLKGFWNRINFLLHGKISVVVLGESQPPMSMRIDSPFEK